MFRALLALAALMAADVQAAGWSLAVHGGAGVLERATMTPEREGQTRAALARALEAGGAILRAGGSALDAVEAAVRVLEDDPNFNAGKGSVYTFEGHHELDAAIMDGRSRAAGAVAGLTRTKNPVSAARAVMERSPHVLLGGDGANRFALEQGLEQVEPGYFRTEERWQQLQTLKSRGAAAFDAEVKYGTVGAVARDSNGHLAAATSTGGLTGKRWGRIGDSPLIGAGTYADDRGCAVSATGSGEIFIRAAVAHEICARLRLGGETGGAAAKAVMDEVRTLGGTGGVIVMTGEGQGLWSFNTPGMYRGRISEGGAATTGIYADDQ